MYALDTTQVLRRDADGMHIHDVNCFRDFLNPACPGSRREIGGRGGRARWVGCGLGQGGQEGD